MKEAFKREAAALRSWYELSRDKRGRTTFGLSGFDIDEICSFLNSFLDGSIPDNSKEDLHPAYTLNLAVDDLKAYYLEAITAQPGQESADSQALSDWFWGETVAAKVVSGVRDACINSDDGLMKVAGKRLLIPVNQGYRFKK